MDGMTVQQGQIVPWKAMPGYVALSYVVSVVGCVTALELLHRRNSDSGRYNWFLLAGAAAAMGGVAIWSMHFIGMCAIVMDGNAPDMQIIYAPSYIVGSLVLAIGVVGIAFFVFSSSNGISPLQTVSGGLICGAAVCGMHYLGQVGMVNYSNVWDPKYVAGSALIAVVAAAVTLGIFFWQKSVWTNRLWKRLLCAVGLSGAVASMHWTAIMGASYAWQGNPWLSSGWNKTDAVWVCCALGLSCCGVLLAFGVLWQYVSMLYAQKARQVSIALAYWDPEGKLMLNSTGLLPSAKITRSYIQRSFKEQFDADHPIFIWLFRLSRNWHCVSGIVPCMKQHKRSEHADFRSYSLDGANGENRPDPILAFKELFCVAAYDLAGSLGLPLASIGVLYDKILDTACISPQPMGFSPNATIRSSHTQETAPSPLRGMTLGRGQLLFLVRKVDRPDALRLQALGFTFAPVNNILGDLAHSMQITSGELKPYLDDLSGYHEIPRGMTPGVHLACFVLKPRIGGFEVLVRKDLRNLLPSVRLSLNRLERWQTALFSAYNDWEAHALLRHWEEEETLRKFSQEQREFVAKMCHAMGQMLHRLGEKLFCKARLIARVLDGPCRLNSMPKVGHGAQAATVVAFRFMTDIHYIHPATYQDTLVPTRLFLAQQHCYPGSPDHTVFGSRVRQELAYAMDTTKPHPQDRVLIPTDDLARKSHERRSTFFKGSPKPLIGTHIKSCLSGNPSPPSAVSEAGSNGAGDNVSEKNLVPHAAENPFGGVHVSNEIEVNITEVGSMQSGESSPNSDGTAMQMSDLSPMGSRTEIEAGRTVERESMMEVLMGLVLGKAAAHER